MAIIKTTIRLKNGTFSYDEFERLFPNATGERKKNTWYIVFPHDENIRFNKNQLYSWNTLCKRMGIINSINKGQLSKWIKLEQRDWRKVRSQIAVFFGFKKYEEIFNNLNHIESVLYTGLLTFDLWQIVTKDMLNAIKLKHGVNPVNQLVYALKMNL